MWFIFQSSVIFAVMASNIHWHWTPNPYLAGLIGGVLAYGATLLLTLCLGSTHPSAPEIKRTCDSL